MPRIGITGHVNLALHSTPLVYRAMISVLRPHAGAGLTGVSCVARGADAIFAQAVLDLDGRLEVLVPARDYRSTLDPDYRDVYDALLLRASVVRTLDHAKSGPAAYEAANHELVGSMLDRLLAVWDGRSGSGRGSTASVVEYARSRSVPVEVIWPEGAERDDAPRLKPARPAPIPPDRRG